MKNNITNIIASVAFGLIISSTAMASEEDYGDDIYVSSSADVQEVQFTKIAFVKQISDSTSVLDMCYSSNE